MSATVRFRGFSYHHNGLDGVIRPRVHELRERARFGEAVMKLFYLKWRLTAHVRYGVSKRDLANHVLLLLTQLGITPFEANEGEVGFANKFQSPIRSSRGEQRILWLAGSGVLRIGLDGGTASVHCEIPMTKIFAVSVPQIVFMNLPMLFAEVSVRNKLMMLYASILIFFCGNCVTLLIGIHIFLRSCLRTFHD